MAWGVERSIKIDFQEIVKQYFFPNHTYGIQDLDETTHH